MLKKLLKKINNPPIRFTIKHYYTFGAVANLLRDKKLDSPEWWDILRTSHPHLSISEKREEWLKTCGMGITKDGQDSNLIKRAKDVVEILEHLKIKNVFSVGSGGAGLEYQIKKMKPEITLTCSEYSKVNVDLLRKVFLECDSIIPFDINTKEWPAELKRKDSLCLIYRLDASFTDNEWERIFKNMFDCGVQNILYIPTNFLTILSFFIRLRQRFLWKINNQPISFAGHLRTRKTFESYWKDFYRQEFFVLGGLSSFVLKRIN